MAPVERKLKDGKLEAVTKEPAAEDNGADVIGLTELLRRSLAGKRKDEAPKSKTARRSSGSQRSSRASRTRKAK